MNKPGDRFRLDRTEKDVAERMMFARRDPPELGRTVFLIGAGCSVTAGIPAVKVIAQQMVQQTVRRFDQVDLSAEDAYKKLLKNRRIEERLDNSDPPSIDWHRVYDMMFERYFTTPDDTRELFSGLVAKANGAINWAHLILGELVARGLISTVLTTNFDQLALSGMVRAGVIPVVCDGLESLNRISGQPTHPQLIEIHGSRHTYTLRNRPDEVASVGADRTAITAIQTLLQHATTFVVIGYGGREDGVMDLLVQAAKAFPNKNLFWIAFSNSVDDLSDKAREFLNSGTNSAALLGRDADQFFFELSRNLGIGAPSAIARPLYLIERWVEDAGRSTSENADIKNELTQARFQLAELRGCVKSKGDKRPSAAIREKRLAGDLEGAWHLVGKVLPDGTDLGTINDELLAEAARTARERGERSPDRAVLERAVALSGALAKRTPRGAAHYAEHQFGYGNALSSLGERESDTARMEEAVAAYHAALEEWNRNSVPLDWAMTQNNLGNALSRLGERESGTARLEEAVAAYRAALEEYTRKRVPLDWAMAQNNLGNALLMLGQRESGTARLEEAVAAYRAALEEYTRERVPLDWAMTQNNLGSALSRLGERESDTARLEEAVAAYRAALEERTRERVPLYWAATQNNLGIALMKLSARESGTERLEEAVAAYREALKEYTRASVPLGWATTFGNEGNALRIIAERTSDLALAERALAQIETARQEFEAAGHEPYATYFAEQADLARDLIDRLKARP